MKLNTEALAIWFGKTPSHFVSGMAAGSIAGAGVGVSHGGGTHSIVVDAVLGLALAGLADVRSFIKLNPMPDIIVSQPVAVIQAP